MPRDAGPSDAADRSDCGCGDTCADADSFVPLTQYIDDGLWDALSGMVDEGDYMELLAGAAAGEEWACKTAGCCGVDVPGGVEGLFEEVVPVSFTGFMDADAADVNRLSNYCISVPTADGDLVPFCGYNMTTEDDVVVLGVGSDGAYAHREYATKHNIQFPLLSDTDGQVSRAYGVLTEEFEGHRDVPGRATFVVDPDRIVQFAWSAHAPEEQPDLDAIRSATNCRDDQCAIEERDGSA